MPQLAIAPTFLTDFSHLDTRVQSATLAAMRSYLSGNRDHLEPVAEAADPQVRVLQIGPEWSGVVTRTTDDVYCLLTVRRHDDAVAFARDYRAEATPALSFVDVAEPPRPTIEIPHPRGPLTAAPKVSGPVELAPGLAKDFDDWRVTLHPEQHRLATGHYAGATQVTGGPGTGKTVLALHRAAYLATRDAQRLPADDRRAVLLTTFNRMLAQTLAAHLDRLIDDPDIRARIDVVTIDSLARGIVAERTGTPPRTLGKDALSRRWRAAARADGVAYSGRFLVDEWEQVILARGFTDLPSYIRCDRNGRMLHLAPEHRALVWETIGRYVSAMRADNEWSYPQVAHEAARLLRRGGPRYRHVVVDEAQDLHPAQWRLLRAAVPAGPDDLFIAADPHQRIYEHRVSLASLGINVRGRGHRLRTSYRVSQEILSWSEAILGRAAAVGLDDRSDTPVGYRSLLRGPAPVLRGHTGRRAEVAAVTEQVRAWLATGVAAPSIAVAGRNQWVVRNIAKELYAAGVPTAALDAAGAADAVRVTTMHKLKGQEFSCVAVIGAGEGLLPPKAALESAQGDPVALEQVYQRERNLLFVACTRARDALYVSYVGEPSRLLPEHARAEAAG
ncbi:UvrD-helicase domain-containing protein [Salinactinospora qingdaonensis]|uniref:DNA 3'-5' helicase n=1 Tax=Salinactinospora qingdaonensis TaxID=702744 RepID=A0ABP7EXM8_9ACTN